MEGSGIIFGIVFGFFISMVVVLFIDPWEKGYQSAMKDAYSMGVAKECLGKGGYYFTCESEDKQ